MASKVSFLSNCTDSKQREPYFLSSCMILPHVVLSFLLLFCKSGTNVAASISFSPIANLQALKKLRILELQDLQIYDSHLDPLDMLPNITQLNLASNFISNDGNSRLSNLCKLQILDISQTSMTTIPQLPSLRVRTFPGSSLELFVCNTHLSVSCNSLADSQNEFLQCHIR